MQTKSYVEKGAIKQFEKKINLEQSFVEDDDGSVTVVNHFAAIDVANKYSVLIQIMDILGQAGYGKITASLEDESSIASGCTADLCELTLSTAEQTTIISCKLQ